MKLLRRWSRIIVRSYIYRYVRCFIQRFFAFVAAIVFVVGLVPRVQAVTPQQGWYISGASRIGSIEYWIISNRRDATIGSFRLRGSLTHFTDSIINSPFITSSGGNYDNNVVDYMIYNALYWQGNSDIPWYVDSDWRVNIKVKGSTVGGIANESFRLLFIDKSKLPSWSYDDNGTTINYGGTTLIPASYSSLFNSGVGNLSTGSTINGLGFTAIPYTYLGFTPFYQMGDVKDFNAIININDLVVCAIPEITKFNYGDHVQKVALVDVDLTFMVPKDKCPPQCELGMSWPYVPTATVNAIEHFDPWKDELQKYSQIPSISDIGNMNTRLNTAVEDAVQVDAAILPVIDELVSVQQFPLFTLLVPLVLAFAILCVLIRRAIN